eukprot:130079-Amphidinium_carterae.1
MLDFKRRQGGSATIRVGTRRNRECVTPSLKLVIYRQDSSSQESTIGGQLRWLVIAAPRTTRTLAKQ